MILLDLALVSSASDTDCSAPQELAEDVHEGSGDVLIEVLGTKMYFFAEVPDGLQLVLLIVVTWQWSFADVDPHMQSHCWR